MIYVYLTHSHIAHMASRHRVYQIENIDFVPQKPHVIFWQSKFRGDDKVGRLGLSVIPSPIYRIRQIDAFVLASCEDVVV